MATAHIWSSEGVIVEWVSSGGGAPSGRQYVVFWPTLQGDKVKFCSTKAEAIKLGKRKAQYLSARKRATS